MVDVSVPCEDKEAETARYVTGAVTSAVGKACVYLMGLSQLARSRYTQHHLGLPLLSVQSPLETMLPKTYNSCL